MHSEGYIHSQVGYMDTWIMMGKDMHTWVSQSDRQTMIDKDMDTLVIITIMGKGRQYLVYWQNI